ncbi:HK97 family phage prohead protease [Gemmata sp.]|uniref:HK97 family phage prohead protease n=1 Tax=Gemmata sp. TaxID=1914242 RepID=UPI003F700C84
MPPPTRSPAPPRAPVAAKPAAPPEGWAYIYGRATNPDLDDRDRDLWPRWWTWTPGAFRASLAAVRAGTRDVRLLVDHAAGRELAGTRDGSLAVWANRNGLRWRVNAGTPRGAAAVAWLRANPAYRAVSLGGSATRYGVRTVNATRHCRVSAFDLCELSFVRVPAFKGGYFTASARRGPDLPGGHPVPPTTDHQTLRALQAVAAAERGQLQAVHIAPAVFAAAVGAGLLARSGRGGYKLTPAGRARIAAGSAPRPAGGPPAMLHF